MRSPQRSSFSLVRVLNVNVNVNVSLSLKQF